MSEAKISKAHLKTKKIKKEPQPQSIKQQSNLNPPLNKPKSDIRFNKAQYDPKFLTPSAKLTKVKVDKRFDKMFKNPEFKTSSKIDRYGRTISPDEQNKELKQYYYMEEEQENSQPIQNEQAQQQIEGDEQEGGLRKWMENYDEQSQSLSQIPYEGQEVQDVWEEQSEHVIKGQNVQATKRLALCNYDWMNISSKDLMILFNSFKTNTGYIKNVKVYMSNLGKSKLEEEEKYGPRGIWKQKPQQQFQPQKKQWRKTFKQLLQQRQQDQNAFDQQKLRQYQKQRLKYFYAVIQCDSKKTADEIYKQCDGNQFQNSNLQFDLRFIPDQIEFDHSSLKQECNQIPVAGEVKNFVTKALGHSKVSLSWEDPQLSLAASLKKKNWNRLTDKELDNIDWGMYINEEDAKNEDGFRKIAGEGEKNQTQVLDWRRKGNKKDRNNDEEDIEITFQGGFDKKNKSKKKTQQVQEQQSLNKQRKSLKEKRIQKDKEKQRRKEQLQLLVDDTKKGDFQVDLNDYRFRAVYENPNYSIDPVDPRFDHRKSGKIFEQIVKRNKNKGNQ